MKIAVLLEWFGQRWERILFYASLVMLLGVFRIFQNDLGSFSAMVQADTRFMEQVSESPVMIDMEWVDRLLRRVADPGAFAQAPLRDIFSVMREDADGRMAQATTQAVPAPGKDGFSLVKIYRQPVRLLFKGYLQLPDGSYSLQINWAGQTDFKEVGETIRGYRIERFEKVVSDVEIQPGYSREADGSYVIIRKESEPPLVLNKGMIVSEKELFAKLLDAQTGQAITVHVGSQIGNYKVLDITEDEVTISGEADEKITLHRTP